MVGDSFGPYRVVEKIGEGGMGEVYKARDTRLDRTVAIKILPPLLAADPQFRERFDREARVVSQLDHPHICTLYDVGTERRAAGDDSIAYLVMQYLEGETLAARLSRGPLPPERALQIAIEIAGALDRAHRVGVVHRDLKPGNVMLTKGGAKLLDFGLAAAGGNMQVLAEASSAFGMSWSGDGTVLFVRGNGAPISRVSSSGGVAAEATRLDAEHASHRFPHFLPDGRRFLYYVVGPTHVRGIYLGELDGTSTRLFDADTAGVFLPPDRVLYGRGDTLVAQRVDLGAGRPIGDPVAVAEDIATNTAVFASIALSVSASGTIAYRTATEQLTRLVWLDRNGKEIGAIAGPPVVMTARGIELSPDDRAAAVVRLVDGNEDIWIVDLERSTWRRVTVDPAGDAGPAWSPDGRRIAFYSGRRSGGGGVNDLYVAGVDQPGTDEAVLENGENKNLGDWSPDGRYLAYSSQTAVTARDIWVLPLEGDRTPVPILRTRFEENNPRFSPNGRWIAYQSNETGTAEAYVRPFLRDGPAVQVSTGGGVLPRWTQGGREIVYRTGEGIVAVPLMFDDTAGTVRPGAPVPLFPMAQNRGVDVSRDGQRFLVRVPLDAAATSPIKLLLNWSGPSS